MSSDNEVVASRPALASGTLPEQLHLAYVSERSDGSSKMIYKQSGGQGSFGTWSTPRALSPQGQRPGQPAIARDGQRQMGIAWTDQLTGSVNVRVQYVVFDKFGTTNVMTPTIKLGTSTNRPWIGEGDPSIDAFPTVAIARGVLNVAYYTSSGTLVLRRSADNGANWFAPITLATDGDGLHPRLVALRSTLLIGYASDDGDGVHTTYRRSTDRGRFWSAPRVLSGDSAPPSYAPVLSQRDGMWRAAFERCGDEACTSSAILYRESEDGLAWGPATTAIGPNDFQAPIGIDLADGGALGTPRRPLLTFLTLNAATDAQDVMSRNEPH